MPRNLLKGLLLRDGRICARKTILTDFPDELVLLAPNPIAISVQGVPTSFGWKAF